MSTSLRYNKKIITVMQQYSEGRVTQNNLMLKTSTVIKIMIRADFQMNQSLNKIDLDN